jgi:hypothetical protein
VESGTNGIGIKRNLKKIAHVKKRVDRQEITC